MTSALNDRFINPFTDFFEQAELAALSSAERHEYEESLKVCQDLQNTMDYNKELAFGEGHDKGKIEGRIEGKKETARNYSPDDISDLTGLSFAEIESLKSEKQESSGIRNTGIGDRKAEKRELKIFLPSGHCFL